MCCVVAASTDAADALPHETALHLLDFLDAVSLSQCAQTSSTWRKLASTYCLWQRLCTTEFGIDGGQADYASRWKQEKHHACANLTLYVDFLDESFFSLAGLFALVSVSVVLPMLLVLKIDGWLAMSWTQVFGSIYGLSFLAVLFVLVRLTLFATVFSPTSSLNNCANYCSLAHIAQCVLVNRDVARKVAMLAAVPPVVNVLPLTLQLFAEGYLATPRLTALVLWLSAGVAVHHIKHPIIKSKRNTQVELVAACAFVASSLALAKATIVPMLPWCVVASPVVAPSVLVSAQSHFQHAIVKRLVARSGLAIVSKQRRLSSSEAMSKAARFYQHHPPLVSLAMLVLKLDGWFHTLPWIVVLIDYSAWVIYGPLAQHARQLVHMMVREMPIPANLRKL